MEKKNEKNETTLDNDVDRPGIFRPIRYFLKKKMTNTKPSVRNYLDTYILYYIFSLHDVCM